MLKKDDVMMSLKAVMQKYEGSPIAQKIMKNFLEREEKYERLGASSTKFYWMFDALTQKSAVSAIKDHAYEPHKNDNWNYKYVNAAKSLEQDVATSLCRVVRWSSDSYEVVNKFAEMIHLYHKDVLGKLTEKSIKSCAFLAYMDSSQERKKRQQEEEELTSEELKQRKMIGQKVEYNPQEVEDFWKKGGKDVNRWKKRGREYAIQTYSKIMNPIMESVGRTAYKTRDSRAVLQTVNNLSLPEVLTFLKTCDHSIMSELYPQLIAVAARDNDVKYLRERVPKIWDEIKDRWKEAEKRFYGED